MAGRHPKRFITVKTAKTGQTVDIPIFRLLFDELSKSVPDGPSKGKGYMFPAQSRMYLDNPDGITWRVRKVAGTRLLRSRWLPMRLGVGTA